MKIIVLILFHFIFNRFATDHLAKTLNESMKLRNGDPDTKFSHLTDCAVKSISNGRPSPQQIGSNGGYGISYTPHYGSNGGVSRNAGEYRPPPYQPQSSPDPLGVIAKRHSPPQQQASLQSILFTSELYYKCFCNH